MASCLAFPLGAALPFGAFGAFGDFFGFGFPLDPRSVVLFVPEGAVDAEDDFIPLSAMQSPIISHSATDPHEVRKVKRTHKTIAVCAHIILYGFKRRHLLRCNKLFMATSILVHMT